MATWQHGNPAILQYCNTATRHHGNDDTLAATRRQPPSLSMAKTHRATTTTEPLEAMRGTQYTCSMPRRRLPTRRQGKHHSSTAAAEYTLRLPQTLPPYASSQLAQTSPQTHSQRAMAVLLLTPQTVNDHNASNQGHSAHATSPTTSQHQDILRQQWLVLGTPYDTQHCDTLLPQRLVYQWRSHHTLHTTSEHTAAAVVRRRGDRKSSSGSTATTWAEDTASRHRQLVHTRAFSHQQMHRQMHRRLQ